MLSFPQLAVSRDTQRSILVERFEDERYPRAHADGFHFNAVVRLRPRGDLCRVQFFVSGTLAALWNAPAQTLRWNDDFDTALPDLSMMALADLLDTGDTPADPTPGEYALRIPVTSELFALLKPQDRDDAELEEFVEAKIYWSWKFKLGPAVFWEWEARRFGVEVEDLHQAAFRKTGSLWECDEDRRYQALPLLVDRFESETTSAETEETRVTRYDVALAFAGEQRAYVEDVAHSLRDAGASVFYDKFADLWGKDLTVELEQVYRSGSRYVVIFVSKEYVEKAWPNEERQHALSGRIERMDNSAQVQGVVATAPC